MAAGRQVKYESKMNLYSQGTAYRVRSGDEKKSRAQCKRADRVEFQQSMRPLLKSTSISRNDASRENNNCIRSVCTYLDMMNAKTLNKSDESWAATGIEMGRPATVKKSLSRDDRINCRVLVSINVNTVDTNGLGSIRFGKTNL